MDYEAAKADQGTLAIMRGMKSGIVDDRPAPLKKNLPARPPVGWPLQTTATPAYCSGQ